jgi:soluble lytic murein transglycosylase-like protein
MRRKILLTSVCLCLCMLGILYLPEYLDCKDNQYNVKVNLGNNALQSFQTLKNFKLYELFNKAQLIDNTEFDYIDYTSEQQKVKEKWQKEIPLHKELQEYTWKLSQVYGVPYEFILATMYRENRTLNLKAINRNKDGSIDKGLMQLNSKYYESYAMMIGVDPKEFDPFDPYQNILVGVNILRNRMNYWYDQNTDDENELLHKTALGYNRGLHGSKKYIKKYKTYVTPYTKDVVKYKKELELHGTFLS